MFLIDSHCHIDRLNYDMLHGSIDNMLKKSYQNNIKKFLTISTSINNFNLIKSLFNQYNSIFYSCGIHPLYCQEKTHNLNQLEKLSNTNKVIALGETGLDYYYSPDTKKTQQHFFREHIRLAKKIKKPIIVHTRNAINDTIKILKEEQAEQCGGIIHSFTESTQEAFKILDIGFYISFSGIITFKKSIELCNTLNKIPLKSLLIETDAPYLSPTPYRGQENQPAYLIEIAKHVSYIKKINLATLTKKIKNNFCKLFNLNF